MEIRGTSGPSGFFQAGKADSSDSPQLKQFKSFVDNLVKNGSEQEFDDFCNELEQSVTTGNYSSRDVFLLRMDMFRLSVARVLCGQLTTEPLRTNLQNFIHEFKTSSLFTPVEKEDYVAVLDGFILTLDDFSAEQKGAPGTSL